MWSFFSRDPTKVFPYEIGERVEEDGDYSIWQLHDGKNKANGQPVSIFAFDVAANSDICKQSALAALKRLRTLRHPNVLTFIDSLESDKFIYMVTEPVKPLNLHLSNLQGSCKEFELSWGLHQIVKGLGFLNDRVNLIHNNICMASMFVNSMGEWKLGGVEYMYPASGDGSNIPPLKPLPALEKYDPPEKNAASRNKKTHKWSVDMWGLGCLVWEVYNGRLPRPSSLKIVNKLPKKLLKYYCELVSANPLSRPSPDKFLGSCRADGAFMANHFVSTNLFLEEIQIKDQKEQSAFFDDLTKHIDDFPSSYSKYKILPQLLNVYQYGNAGPNVLPPLFKLGKFLNEEEYQSQIVPCVVKLFTSTDRATRIHLLRQLPLFAEHLKPQVVNAQVFPNMVTGFMDTNPVIREQTIKGMLLLAPKLNDANLNTELMKHFARLQSRDDQGPIRTNTTVCLGKITEHLNAVTRQRVITSAYARAMKDPFPAARSAGLLSMNHNIKYYTLKDCAYKCVPSISALTVDPDKLVRDHAFKALKSFVDKLEGASNDPEKAAKLDEEANVAENSSSSSSSSGNPAKWASWVGTGVSSITSKLYSSSAAQQQNSAAEGKQAAPNTAASSASTSPLPPDQANKPTSSSQPEAAAASEKEEEAVAEDEEVNNNDGWDDEDNWDELEESLGDESTAKTTTAAAATAKQVEVVDDGWGNEWNDDDNAADDADAGWNDDSWDSWGAGEKKKEAKAMTSNFATSNTYNWNEHPAATNNDNFFDEITTHAASVKPKPAKVSLSKKPTAASVKKSTAVAAVATKTPTSSKPEVVKSSDDWGWGDEWAAPNEGKSKADQAKLEREERRKQRKKEIEERRANKGKLGTRKCD